MHNERFSKVEGSSQGLSQVEGYSQGSTQVEGSSQTGHEKRKNSFEQRIQESCDKFDVKYSPPLAAETKNEQDKQRKRNKRLVATAKMIVQMIHEMNQKLVANSLNLLPNPKA